MSRKRREIPRFEQPLIETHCHLDYLKDQPLEAVLDQAGAVGIERVVTISVAPDNLDTVRALAERWPQVWCTQGVHPHDAGRYDDAAEARIRDALGHPRVLAVGEIGLDYYYDHSDRAVQRAVFERQLQLAVDHQRPVVIHTREADADTRAILAGFVDQLPARKGVIHSFTSGPELAGFCLEAGFCLGFNGICTFNKAENVREIVRMTPLEQLLLETDSPYLTPVPYRGRENAPCYLPFVAEKIAEVKDRGIDVVLDQCYRNSLRLFFDEPVRA